jgi:hypothetical protein
MAYAFAISTSAQQRGFTASATITVTTGTYPVGGIGPLALCKLNDIPAQSNIPIRTEAASVGHPPSGIVYQYDPTTDKLRAMVTGASAGTALAEFSGTIPADIIQVTQTFGR